MPLKDKEARRNYHRGYMARRLAEDPEYKAGHIERVRRNDARYREEVRQIIQAFKVNGCVLCHEKEECCLSAHHLDGTGKDFSIGDAANTKKGPKRVQAELAKCICVCENCHRKLHAGIISLP